MDYRNFKVEDFAADEYFVRWVLDKDQDTDEFWQLFLLTNPHLEYEIEQARRLLLNIRTAEGHTDTSTQVQSVWHRIEKSIDPSSPHKPIPVRKPSRIPWLVAASLFLIALFTIYQTTRPHLEQTNVYASVNEGFVEQANDSGHPVTIRLADGSTLELADNSRIKYRRSYETQKTREVYLSGTAFFSVQKNPEKPFLVHSNEIVTEVLGTSFRVEAPLNSSQVVVSVKTGKVSVYSAIGKTNSSGKDNGVILLPNQEVAFQRREKMFSKKLVDEPQVIQPGVNPAVFNFDNAPIKEVFKTLQEAYGVEIIFDEDVMRDCFLTAPLGSESLFEKLQIICETIGGKYELLDAKVVISNAGCRKIQD